MRQHYQQTRAMVETQGAFELCRDDLDGSQSQECHLIPQHIALIMDGNGRWAVHRGQPRTEGHRAAVNNMMGLVRLCLDMGVRYLTLYVFSTENWKRPPQEVDGMLNLVGEVIDRELSTIHAWGVRLLHLGQMEGIDERLRDQVHHALDLTRSNDGLTLSIALNYGGRADLVNAVRLLLSKGIAPSAIDEETIAAHLSTRGLPDTDLVIRTSGEQRLSNFLLWESAHCLFWTTPVYWPDFQPCHLQQAINDYQAHHESRLGAKRKAG